MELSYDKGSPHAVCLICFKVLQSRRFCSPDVINDVINGVINDVINVRLGRNSSSPGSTIADRRCSAPAAASSVVGFYSSPRVASMSHLYTDDSESTDSEQCVYQDFDDLEEECDYASTVTTSAKTETPENVAASQATEATTYDDLDHQPKDTKVEEEDHIYLDVIQHEDVAVSSSPRTMNVLYRFAGVEEGEVSVEKHDTVEEVLADQGDGWTEVRTSQGICGVVPTSYLKYQVTEKPDSGQATDTAAARSHQTFNNSRLISRPSRHSKTRKASRRKTVKNEVVNKSTSEDGVDAKVNVRSTIESARGTTRWWWA